MTGYATGTDNETTTDGTWTVHLRRRGQPDRQEQGQRLKTWTYTYDNKNHLTGREKSNGRTTAGEETFTYDVQGNLVQQAEYTSTSGTTTTTRFAVDACGDDVVRTWTAATICWCVIFTEMGTDQLLTRTVASGTNAACRST